MRIRAEGNFQFHEYLPNCSLLSVIKEKYAIFSRPSVYTYYYSTEYSLDGLKLQLTKITLLKFEYKIKESPLF